MNLALEQASEEDLWAALDEVTPHFLGLWESVHRGSEDLPDPPDSHPDLVDLCRELTQRMLSHCNFCRWNCKVDRSRGMKFGTCKLAGESRVASYFHHQGEELIYFMSQPAMKILRVLMDIWLPDLKFGPGKCAVTLSRTPWYWETVTENLKLIYEWGEDFTIRHLVMPNHGECCTRPILEWIAEVMPDVPVNLMDQYHPDNFCDPRSAKYDKQFVEIAHRPSKSEMMQAFRYARELGLRFEALSYEKNMT